MRNYPIDYSMYDGERNFLARKVKVEENDAWLLEVGNKINFPNYFENMNDPVEYNEILINLNHQVGELTEKSMFVSLLPKNIFFNPEDVLDRYFFLYIPDSRPNHHFGLTTTMMQFRWLFKLFWDSTNMYMQHIPNHSYLKSKIMRDMRRCHEMFVEERFVTYLKTEIEMFLKMIRKKLLKFKPINFIEIDEGESVSKREKYGLFSYILCGILILAALTILIIHFCTSKKSTDNDVPKEEFGIENIP